MKKTIDHNLEASIMMWLDYVLVSEQQGFYNYSGYFNATNSDIQGIYAYAAPHRQFVYDSSVTGAIVPSGVSVDGVFTPKGTGSALRIDYMHGQALAFSSLGDVPVSGSYSYKEVNLYIIDRPEEEILFGKKFDVKPKYGPVYTGVAPGDQPYPAILIQSAFGKNETLDFAGLAETTVPVRFTVLADSAPLLKSICGTMRDKQETYLPLFEDSELPFTKFYDLKAPYSYMSVAQTAQGNSNRLVFLQNVTISPFQQRVNSLIGDDTFGAFVDIDFLLVRNPHG